MAPADQIKTRISTKGQVILPKQIRERRQWNAGTELVVEETAEGVLLKPANLVPRTDPEKVFRMLAYRGKPKTVEEMNAGVLAEAKRQHDRG
jgi:AbrB family looped-hinge helix DNA binding protein